MATNMFMKLGNKIKGEAEDVDHPDWCEITDLGHDFSQGASPMKATTIPKSTDTYLNVDKFSDSATTEILKACWSGTIIPKVEIKCFRAGGDGLPVDYLKIELENAVIHKYELETQGEGLSKEKLELDYTHVKYTYKAIVKHTGKAKSVPPAERKFAEHDRERIEEAEDDEDDDKIEDDQNDEDDDLQAASGTDMPLGRVPVQNFRGLIQKQLGDFQCLQCGHIFQLP